MELIASIAGLLASCALSLWAAMSAGRATRGESPYGWLTLEFVTFFASLGAASLASVAVLGSVTDWLSFMGLFIVWTAVGYLLAGILVFLEYARRGRRERFRPDLSTSLWIGRAGLVRPFGGKPRPR